MYYTLYNYLSVSVKTYNREHVMATAQRIREIQKNRMILMENETKVSTNYTHVMYINSVNYILYYNFCIITYNQFCRNIFIANFIFGKKKYTICQKSATIG